MGRYITGDFEYKFWFGSQPSSDILEYGVEDHDNRPIQFRIDYEDLDKIIAKVEEYKKFFNDTYKRTYDDFIAKMDEEFKTKYGTEEYKQCCRDASKIALGLKIIQELKEQESDLYGEAEI